MKPTKPYDHDLDDVIKALGIDRSDSDLNRLLVSGVTDKPRVVSDYLGRIVESANTPEEIAYMAYKLGYATAKAEETEKRMMSGFFSNR